MNAGSRFLSIQFIARRAAETLRRFPYVLTTAMVGTATAIYLVSDRLETPQAPFKLLLVCLLGVPLLLALTTMAERKPWSATAKRVFPAAGVLLLAVYYLSLPEVIEKPNEHLVRFALLLLASHLLVAFLPFVGKQDRPGFWQYNKTLFIRILLAHLYFQVLFAGLALALVAADNLFGLNVDGITYPRLGVLLVGAFQTWVFLAGIPKKLDELNRSEEYPPGLKVFTQFILLPLVSLYFLILITYEAKILTTWNWPEGWVAYLVLSFSVVGILSLLLLHPLQTREGSRWIAAFGNWFFRGLVPLVIMLYFAIFQRIAEYGVTVNRFLVVNMAVGLTLVVLYFVLGRARDIRAIPIVLCFLAMVSAYGPFSAFAVSERSQRDRLSGYMTQYGILENGLVRKAPDPVSEVDRREMSSIIAYLLEWHGSEAFAGWVDSAFLAEAARDSVGNWRDSLTQRMGFAYQPDWRYAGGPSHFYFNAERGRQEPLSLSGWTYLIEYSYDGPDDSLRVFKVGEDSCYVSYDSARVALNLAVGPDRYRVVRSASADLDSLIIELQSSDGPGSGKPAQLVLAPDSAGVRCLWLIERLSGSRETDQTALINLRANVLIGID